MLDSDELLIDLDNIRNYVKMAKNMQSDNRILHHIIEAQRFDLAEWFGNAFYLDLWTNKPLYTLILDGGTYIFEGKTYQLYGLKAYLCYMSGLRIIRENEINITTSGNVVKETEQSNAATLSQEQNQIRAIQNKALAYRVNIAEYLCRFRDLYPLYDGCANNEQIKDKTLQISINKGKYGNVKW